MATNDELRGFKPFDCRGDSTSVGPRWRRWRKSFQFYVDGRGITAAARRKALLLHCAGMEVQEIFEKLTDPGAPEGEDDDVYKAALRTLDAYFTPQVNVPYERHIFRQMKQEEHETVDQFVVRLSNQAANCEFGATKNEQIRDQIIDKCKSTELRRKLLGKGQELTLADTQKIARSLELTQTQAKQIEGDVGASVNAIKEDNKPEGNGRSDQKSLKCYRCGQSGDFARDKHCPARSKTCTKCHRQGILPQSAEQRVNKSRRIRTHGNKVEEKLTVWRMVKMMNMLLLWDSVNHGTGVDQRWSIYKLEVLILMEFSSTQDHHVISLIRRRGKN